MFAIFLVNYFQAMNIECDRSCPTNCGVDLTFRQNVIILTELSIVHVVVGIPPCVGVTVLSSFSSGCSTASHDSGWEILRAHINLGELSCLDIHYYFIVMFYVFFCLCCYYYTACIYNAL